MNLDWRKHNVDEFEAAADAVSVGSKSKRDTFCIRLESVRDDEISSLIARVDDPSLVRRVDVAGALFLTRKSLIFILQSFPNAIDLDLSHAIEWTDDDLNDALPVDLVKLSVSCAYELSDAFILRDVSRIHTLRELNLSGVTALTDVGVRCVFLELKALERLDLSGVVHVSDDGLCDAVHSATCSNLKALLLTGCWSVKDAGVCAVVDAFPRLVELSLSGLRELSSIRPLKRLTQLNVLYLDGLLDIDDQQVRDVLVDVEFNFLSLKGVPLVSDATLTTLELKLGTSFASSKTHTTCELDMGSYYDVGILRAAAKELVVFALTMTALTMAAHDLWDVSYAAVAVGAVAIVGTYVVLALVLLVVLGGM